MLRAAAVMKSPTAHPGETTIRRLHVEDMFIARLEYEGSPHLLWNELARLISGSADRVHGPPFCLFHHETEARNQRIECCVPVRPFNGSGDIRTGILPGARMLSWIHRGSFQSIGESWERLFDYIESMNITIEGPRREIYLGVHTPDGSIMRAELQVPLPETARYTFIHSV